MTLTLNDALAIGRRDAHDQVALVRTGEISQAELIEAAILRIEALDGSINAVSHRAFDIARERARRATPVSASSLPIKSRRAGRARKPPASRSAGTSA